MRILLVEDDVVLRGVMVRSLKDAGHRVDESGTLEEAEHLWRVQAFDVVLLDLNLPHSAHPRSGLGSGVTALRNARARGDRTPVMILTARNRKLAAGWRSIRLIDDSNEAGDLETTIRVPGQRVEQVGVEDMDVDAIVEEQLEATP